MVMAGRQISSQLRLQDVQEHGNLFRTSAPPKAQIARVARPNAPLLTQSGFCNCSTPPV